MQIRLRWRREPMGIPQILQRCLQAFRQGRTPLQQRTLWAALVALLMSILSTIRALIPPPSLRRAHIFSNGARDFNPLLDNPASAQFVMNARLIAFCICVGTCACAILVLFNSGREKAADIVHFVGRRSGMLLGFIGREEGKEERGGTEVGLIGWGLTGWVKDVYKFVKRDLFFLKRWISTEIVIIAIKHFDCAYLLLLRYWFLANKDWWIEKNKLKKLE